MTGGARVHRDQVDAVSWWEKALRWYVIARHLAVIPTVATLTCTRLTWHLRLLTIEYVPSYCKGTQVKKSLMNL